MSKPQMITIERVYEGDGEIQAWWKEERERQEVCPLAYGFHVSPPSGGHHWKMVSERTL
jgi:hypothetical protein